MTRGSAYQKKTYIESHKKEQKLTYIKSFIQPNYLPKYFNFYVFSKEEVITKMANNFRFLIFHGIFLILK